MNSSKCLMSTVVSTIAVAGLYSDQVCAQDSWTDRISFSGDLRPRYEYIDAETQPVRPRERFRARIAMTAEVNDNIDVVFRLSSGGDAPTSGNQTFDGGFTRKEIGIDLAYADWTINDDLDLFVGKMKNPIRRTGSHHLIWDSDLNPEGLALDYGSGAFFGTFGAYSVEERSSGDDSFLYSVQGGMSFDLAADSKLIVGAGYHVYTNTIGNKPFWLGLSFGNSVDADGNLIYDYNQAEVFAEYSTNIGKLPLSFFANYVQNVEVDINDTGQAYGVRIGKTAEPGTWQASWAWQELEADAVIDTFTDSDFGNGGTDARGHTIKAAYALKDNLTVGGTLFVNEIDLASGTPSDYTRLQLDLNFSF